MRYSLTALTPTLVADGRELSPVDYMVWKDQVNVLDQTRIFRLLSRGPRLEGYLGQLRKATKLDFASWGGFAQNFSQRRIPFENAECTAIWNAAASENLFIPTFATDHRGPYLPASAVKGALRTGLVFSRWNGQTMERVASAIENDRLPRRATDAAENSAHASQVRIVSVADSDPAAANAFKVYLTRVASIDTRQAGKPQLAWKVAGRGSVAPQRANEATPLFAEMATPGTKFQGEWGTRAFLENPELARALGWRSAPEPKAFFDAANDYAAAQLQLHASFAQTVELKALTENVERLAREVEAARSQPDTCILCLGWGGGFLSKAGFLQTDDAAYRRVLRAVPALSRSIREGVVFPKTRRVVYQNSQPATIPGWTRLQLYR